MTKASDHVLCQTKAHWNEIQLHEEFEGQEVDKGESGLGVLVDALGVLVQVDPVSAAHDDVAGCLAALHQLRRTAQRQLNYINALHQRRLGRGHRGYPDGNGQLV